MPGRVRRWCGVLALSLATSLATATAAARGTGISLVDDRGKTLRLEAPAHRIVSLLPSLTETLCQMQACGRLVGVDRHANWPASINALPRLGGLDDPQVERIVALKPDLVLAAVSTRLIDRLEALGLNVLALEPRTLADLQRVQAVLASAIGQPEAAGRAWLALQAQIDHAARRIDPAWHGRGVYLEVASTPHAAGAASYLGELLVRLGLRSVVPAALGPFPQLSPEFVLRAQPDLVLASRAGLAQMGRRGGLSQLNALRRGQACGFDALQWDTLMRPGPRLAEGAEAIAACLEGLARP